MKKNRPFFKKNNFKTHSLVFLCCLLVTCFCCNVVAQSPQNQTISTLLPEIGYPLVQNFSLTDYNAASQNWAIAQSPNGFIYVGNNHGVLEFDGKNWRLYKTEKAVKSLAINDKGEIFVGTNNGFGMLTPDSTHTLHYVSLVNQLPKEKSNFTDVWQTFTSENKVYFRTSEYIFIFKDKKLEKIIDSKDKFHTGFFTNNTFYVKDNTKGVLKLNQNNELEPIANQVVGGVNVYGVFDESDELTIFIRSKGIVKIKNKIVSSQKPQSTEILTESRAYCSMKLSENQFVIGTLRNGVFITDKKGDILLHLNEENILANNAIYAMFLDKDKSLWLATDNGIDCIYLGIPYSTIGVIQGIKGKGLNIEYSSFYQKMYIGTTTGIYQNDFPQKVSPLDGTQTKFEILEDTEGYALSTLNQNKTLYYGHNLGMVQVKNDKAQFIGFGTRRKVTWGIVPTSDSTKFIKLHNKGIALAKKKINGKWTEKIYPNFEQSIRHLVQNEKYWWTSNEKDLFRLTFSESYDSLLEVKTYSKKIETELLPENKILEINNKLFFRNGKDIYLYDTQKDEFVKSDLFDSYFEGNKIVFLEEDEEGNIWYKLEKEKANERGILWKKKDNNSDFLFRKQNDFTRGVKSFNSIVTSKTLPNQKLALGVEDGFLIIDAKKEFKISEKIDVKVRKIEFLGESDSLLFGGVFFDADSLVIENQSKNQELKLESDFNALRFSFASPYPIFAEKTEYRYKLKGLDNKWSVWSEKSQKEYTNLSDGKYQFIVQAKNIWGIESEETVYKFEIYPPWYKTWEAYIIYVFLAILLVWAIVKLNIKRLERDKKNLESIITQRTLEINQQKEEIVQQNQQLEKQQKFVETAYQNISLLSDVGKQITSNLSTEMIVEIVYESVNKLLDASVFGIGIYNEKENSLDFINSKERDKTLPFQQYFFTTDSLPSYCFNKNAEIFINNLEKEYNNFIPAQEIKDLEGELSESLIYIPIVYKDETIGVLTVQSFKKDSYTENHLNLVRNIAIYAAIALVNARSYQQIEKQSNAITLQNNNIKSSISYASRIQKAILPPIEKIKSAFDDAFVLWLPRDVVSGDFYFYAKVESKICIAAIDCTGHGVPGAFMSMIGNDLLNQIIIENKITEPSEILAQLHQQVVSSLRQTETQNRDGMDMAVCIYDETTKELSFAGAKNPLYYIQDGELKNIAGSKSPIGGKWGGNNERVYQTHTLSIEEETTFFLCTDGYQDQFGGDKNKKMMRKRMKSFLLEVADLDGQDQKEKLEKYFFDWKNNQEQIDDVLIIGFKIGKNKI